MSELIWTLQHISQLGWALQALGFFENPGKSFFTFGATATTLIVGSLIPDGDTVLKLKDNATYISHHRGITHSIPFHNTMANFDSVFNIHVL